MLQSVAFTLALLAEEAALCLRPEGGSMMIGDREFDQTHNPVLRNEIRTFAEGLL